MKRSPSTTERKPSRRELRAEEAAAVEDMLASMSVPERARFLISRFGVFGKPPTAEEAQRRLVTMGADAVPMLVHALDDPKNGWRAAMTLAQIGPPAAAAALPELLRHAWSNDSGSNRWSQVALARLGQLDELFALLDQPVTDLTLQALAEVTPRSYPWLERALDRKDMAIRKAAANALRPGRGRFFDPAADEFEQVVSGARSAHAIIRMDAALLLVGVYSRAFPRSTQAEAVRLLADLLRDSSSEVRRLAALSLGRVGKRVAPAALEALATALTDKNAKVREAAVYSQRRLTPSASPRRS